MPRKVVVVCGITGTQGGWVYEALKDSYDVVGFSRDVERAREKLGAKSDGGGGGGGPTLVEADLNDVASLRRAFRGADYVFGMSQPWSSDYRDVDVEGEVEQGRNIVRACLDCGVKHLVFSSASHDGVKTGIPHVDSKIDIERHIRESGLSHTILGPVQFMDNVGMPFFPVQPTGWIRGFVDADAKVPYVSVRDVGLATRAVLRDPEAHAGRTYKLLGDTVSGTELAEILTRLRRDGKGETFRYYAIPRWIVRLMSKEFYAMRVAFEEFGRDPKAVARAQNEISELRKELIPELSSMEDHLRREGFATRELISEEEQELIRKRRRIILHAAVVGVGLAAAAFGATTGSEDNLASLGLFAATAALSAFKTKE